MAILAFIFDTSCIWHGSKPLSNIGFCHSTTKCQIAQVLKDTFDIMLYSTWVIFSTYTEYKVALFFLSEKKRDFQPGQLYAPHA